MRHCAICIPVAMFAICLISVPVEGKTILIQDDGSGDEADIQAGITAAVDGDTVMLADGSFTGAGNYDIDFMNKAITVTSAIFSWTTHRPMDMARVSTVTPGLMPSS